MRRSSRPLVSAIGVSFVLMNVGLLWGGAADRHFPDLVSHENLLGEGARSSFTYKDLMVVGVTVPIMIALTCSCEARGSARPCGPRPRIRWPRN